jgi:energy-coupling factor transporter ATP-binding protein EcfA2
MSAFSSSIGYVSQHNVLRPELTVEETFREQSILRLPRDSLTAERESRIEEVLDFLGITPLRTQRVSRLSGGEMRRVQLGIELLSSPTVIFLDEPLAGLDPGLVHRFMLLFRSLADKGHTILLTTHTLEQIDLCDRLLFLHEGRVVYDGEPAQSDRELEVASLAQVYEKAREGLLTARSCRNAGEEQQAAPDFGMPQKWGRYRPRAVGLLRQLRILTPRYGRILLRDYRSIILMLLQAPLIALLLSLVFKSGISFLPLSFHFCVSISAIWIGGVTGVREIAREWDHVDGEFRSGMSSLAFLSAKIIVLCLFSIAQASLFGATLHLLFASFSLTPQIFTLTAAAVTSGSILGMAISAFSRTVNQAIVWLPLVLIPQIFFSGILVPFDRMSSAGRLMSRITLARPVFTMFKERCVLERSLWVSAEWLPLSILGAVLCIFTFIRIRWFRPVTDR